MVAKRKGEPVLPARSKKKGGLVFNCALTADAVVFVLHEGRGARVLLVQRGYPPYKGRWALPGGFVDAGERTLDAARRELFEETGMRVGRLYPVGCFSDPERDPRGRTVSEAFAAVLAAPRVCPQAGDDAAAARLFPLRRLPPLAFDHAKIVARAHRLMRAKGLLS